MFSLGNGFLASEKAPYIVTLFVAAASWTALHTADRLASTPFVEYRLEPMRLESGDNGFELRVRNITVGSRFDCFALTLTPRSHESLRFGDATKHRQRLRGTVLAFLDVRKAKDIEWEVEATKFAPGADVSLVLPAHGLGEPAVLVDACTANASGSNADEKGSLEKNDTRKAVSSAVPVLVRRSAMTFFVEYEIPILWALLGLWLVLLVLFTWRPRSRTKRVQASNVSGGTYDEPGSID